MKYSAQIRNHLAIIIDYTIPVFKKRLWVIDISSGEIWLNTFVGHAKKSGLIRPIDYSNMVGSKKSCYGSFLTSSAYNGSLGYSMKLIGLEKDNNNNALKRGIIFHSWWIPLFSQGCFITLPSDNKYIIDMTKNGSFVFVYK